MGDLLLSIIIWGSIFGNSSLGILAYIKNRKNIVNISLFLLAITSALWAVSLFFYQHPFYFSSYIWLKITYIVVVFLVIFFFLFSLVFPRTQNRSFLVPLLTSIITSLPFVYTIIFGQLFVKEVVYESWGPKQYLGSIYPFFGIWASIFSAWTIINYWKGYSWADGLEKLQFRYLFIGMFMTAIIPIYLDIILPVFFGNSRYIWFSPISSMFLVGFTAYAVVKHRLMDIRIALQGTIIFLITSILIGIVAFAGALSYWLIVGVNIKPEVFLVTLGVGLALTLIYSRILDFSKAIASKFFFQSVYDYQQVVKDLSHSFATIIDLEKLAEVIIDTLSKVLRVDRVGVLVWDPIEKHYKIEKSVGFNEHNGISSIQHDFLATYLEKHPQIIVREEIQKMISDTDNADEKKLLTEFSGRMEHIEASLIIPVVNAGKLIGLIVLGDKKSGDPFTVQDVNMLATISSQAGIAFENATLYSQLSDLNQNLLKKVDERTSELQKANLELKTLDVMKDQLIGITSHELKTPLSNAQNYLWYVLNHPAKETKLAVEDTEKLKKSLLGIQDLVKLINNILNVSRIEAGKMKVNLERKEFKKLEEIIKKVMDEFELKLKQKNLKVSYRQDEGSLPAVSVDLMKFEEVLTNLLSNAAKYTDQGEIKVSVEKEGKTLMFAVSDTGRGIAKEHLFHVFEKFFREDTSLSASNPQTGGTGLGLYIAKSLVELMGGKMSVASTLGKGSTFYFTLLIL